MDFRDERERLIAEQAVLQYRAVQEAAAAAKYGHGLEAMEVAALAAMRYLKEHLLPQVKASRRDDAKGEKAMSLRALFGYLWSHRGRKRYRDRLRRGLPIGSGQIEGVCKNTLNRRLRLNNPRWRPEHAQDMAALCCLHTSGQWDAYWSHAA